MNVVADTLSAEEQAAFLLSAQNVRDAAIRHLQAQREAPYVIAFVRNMQRGVNQIVQTAAEQGAGLACRPGCNHCCSARVEATAPEIFLIAQDIRSRPPEEASFLVQCLQAHAATPGELAPWRNRAPCPFLRDQLCSIYQVRPGVCRKAHSLDAEACKRHESVIPQNLAVLLSAEALAKGTADAYRQLGFEASAHELVHAVLLALSDATLETRWHAGELVFAAARTASRR